MMPDREKVINELNDCLENQHIEFMDGVGDIYAVSEETIRNVIALLKEQEETIRNLEQEIRDKNERLKERAEQVDSMLKERKPVEPSRDIALNRRCPKCFAILKGKFCHKCGQAVKWDERR